MEILITFIQEHAHLTHLIIFFLLMLAGLNAPLSEDLLVITGGYLAATNSDHVMHWYLWIFAGCWLSAWESYWLGRALGPKLYEIRWFKRIINPQKIEKLHNYFEKFGIFTFIIGRFIPGGVRNVLFMSSGLGKMPFTTFMIRDGVSCLIASSVLFLLGYSLANNSLSLLHLAKKYHLLASIFIGVIAVVLLVTFFLTKKK